MVKTKLPQSKNDLLVTEKLKPEQETKVLKKRSKITIKTLVPVVFYFSLGVLILAILYLGFGLWHHFGLPSPFYRSYDQPANTRRGSHLVIIPDSEATPISKIDSWKLYRTDKFEFRYPSNWQIFDGIPDDHIVQTHHNAICNGPVFFEPDNPSFILITEMGQDIKYSGICQALNTENPIDSREESFGSISISKPNRQGGNNITDYLEIIGLSPDYKDAPTFRFGVFYHEDLQAEIRPIFDEIVGSFKYADKYYFSQPTNIEWSKFRSELLDYEFEYPTFWGKPTERIYDAVAEHSGDSGQTYGLSFENMIDLSEFSRVVAATGQSDDYSAARGIYYKDFAGYPDETAEVFTKMGLNVTNCHEDQYRLDVNGRYPQQKAYIEFNLPGRQISGVRLFVPILSPNIVSFNKSTYCGLTNRNTAQNALVSLDLFIQETEELQDSETRTNLMIYKKILQSAKIY